MCAIWEFVSHPSRPGTENFWSIALTALLTVAIPMIVSTSQTATTRRRWRRVQRVNFSMETICITKDWYDVELVFNDARGRSSTGCSCGAHRFSHELGCCPLAPAVRKRARGALRPPPARVRRAQRDRGEPGDHAARHRRERRGRPQQEGGDARRAGGAWSRRAPPPPGRPP